MVSFILFSSHRVICRIYRITILFKIRIQYSRLNTVCYVDIIICNLTSFYLSFFFFDHLINNNTILVFTKIFAITLARTPFYCIANDGKTRTNKFIYRIMYALCIIKHLFAIWSFNTWFIRIYYNMTYYW